MQIKALEKRGIPYIIKDTKIKKLAVEVKNDATIVIKKHRSISNQRLISFIDEHLDWIEQAFLKKYKPPRKFISGEEYLLLGKTYTLNVIHNSINNVICDIDYGKTIDIYTKEMEPSYIENLINHYLDELASTIFNILFENALNKTNQFFKSQPQLYIKSYKSRWGCCIPKENKIILNKALIHVDIELIMYVIYHELCHMQYLNHSADFHHLLKNFVPNEKDLRKRLNQFSSIYR